MIRLLVVLVVFFLRLIGVFDVFVEIEILKLYVINLYKNNCYIENILFWSGIIIRVEIIIRRNVFKIYF